MPKTVADLIEGWEAARVAGEPPDAPLEAKQHAVAIRIKLRACLRITGPVRHKDRIYWVPELTDGISRIGSSLNAADIIVPESQS